MKHLKEALNDIITINFTVRNSLPITIGCKMQVVKNQLCVYHSVKSKLHFVIAAKDTKINIVASCVINNIIPRVQVGYEIVDSERGM